MISILINFNDESKTFNTNPKDLYYIYSQGKKQLFIHWYDILFNNLDFWFCFLCK